MIIGYEFHITTPKEVSDMFSEILMRKFVRVPSKDEMKNKFKNILDADGWRGWYNGKYAEFDITEDEYKKMSEIFLASKKACRSAYGRGLADGKEKGKNALIMLNTGEMSESDFLKF
jgi:hypothetical protein